ncbi:hypothetical protein Ais01nite_00340 [Asanoa ishikariensis]|uniref:Uncharacterized protein n=1 Tax=Asanoa ishikariensis TaxID=137265 RepID=A0A1H3TSN4_9ACTN|nr:hypothetical protein Ais01nite_00340 [Asanoa ishikariensis]SDZ52339.1 hypothetical protein SAMN05421684_6189 [Asanoa ishikariensis]
MRRLGMMTAGLGAGLALVALVMTVRSIPDIRRYLKIRSM